MIKFRLILLTVLAFSANTVRADLSIQPFTKGSFSEIKSQYNNKPFVLVFWSESCSYCMKELAMFGKLYKQYPDIAIITVATDPFLDDQIVKNVLNRSGLALDKTWVFAEQFPERIYADINKRWRGELPVTHFFDRVNQETRHMGIVKENELIEWLNAQSVK
ncbi:MAG: TlpA family protein disulfide reductase [Methylococcales bacterium]|nr:TlpA family protein disulfide reductase [Methylococcales bacterium]